MATDYEEIAQGALEQIKEDGQLMTLKKTTGGTVDFGTSERTGATEVTTNFYGVQLNIETSKSLFDQARSEGLVIRNTALILAEAVSLEFEPLTNQRVRYGGKEWEIFGIKEVNPAGTVCLYKFGVVKR